MRRLVALASLCLSLTLVGFSAAQAAEPTLPEQAAKSVVIVHTVESVGAGVVVEEGTVVTAAHVVDGTTRPKVEWDGARYQASVVAIDEGADLARLRVPDLPAQPLAVATQRPIPGVTAYAIGAPGGALSVTRGVVSAFVRRDGVEYLQTDAAINKGNSGGPLVDDAGQVLGVVVAKERARDGIGYAVAGETLKSFLANGSAGAERPVRRPDPDADRESEDRGIPVILAVSGVALVALLLTLRRRPPARALAATPAEPLVVLGRVLPPESEKEHAQH